jgi:hypothetical protein
MAAQPRIQGLAWRHRQVLAVLARAPPRGRDVNALLTLEFKLETMADLILSGQATIRIEIVKERDSKIEVACVRITDAGWQSLGLNLKTAAEAEKASLRPASNSRGEERWHEISGLTV